jgi:hypothetical protein
MSIPFSKYINIISGVVGAAAVGVRELIARLYTGNNLTPTGTVVEFTSATAVGNFYGTTSVEYLRALFYFGFTSKSITKAEKISFYFWAENATAPLIHGDKVPKSLGDFTPVADGAFSLTMGAETNVVSGLDFTLAGTLADVATIIQAGIQAASGNVFWATATVTYNATRGSFDLVGGSTGNSAITTGDPMVGTDILNITGWVDTGLISTDGAIFSAGSDAKTVTDTMIESSDLSNNFGSFLFIPALTDIEIAEASVWNAAENVKYMFMLPGAIADAGDFFTDLKDNGGTGFTVSEVSTQYPEMLPMALFASTKYTRRNSTKNYMFQDGDNLDASVTDGTLSDSLDAVRANYIGETQQAGQKVNFYQRGSLYGSLEDPIAMNVYANEIWLKDFIGVELMNLLIALEKVSANKTGRGQVMTTVQVGVDAGLFNGVISVGKPLTNAQKSVIEQISGSSTTWHQVQNLGYWFDAVIESFQNESNETEFKATYTLIYSKDDAIRKVDGVHALV